MRSRRIVFLRLLLLIFIGVVALYFINKLFNGNQKENIPIIILEEHHEALLAWIDAANEGLIPKTKNTLIHIDGHSDDALPHYISSFPFFHWPANDLEIYLMMQQNDIFIICAVIIGLIDRFIWISPEWNDDTKTVKHDVVQVEIGFTKIEQNSKEELMFCKCSVEKYHKLKTCVYFNDTYEPPNSPEVDLVPISKCEIKSNFTFEVLSAERAVKTLKHNPEWIKPQESLILDIDEDYFGCQIPGQNLYDVGMNWSSITHLNLQLTFLFCPKHIGHEHTGSELMTKILTMLLVKCDASSNQKMMNLEKCLPINILQDHIYDIALNSWKNDPLLFCARNNVDLKKSTQKVVREFHSLSLLKLHAILKLGFCFNTSPQTIWFEQEGMLVICHGNNDPARPMVQTYLPEIQTELPSSLHTVTTFLDIWPLLKLVTICRSVRDGYTPRYIFKAVEDHFLNFFRRKNRFYKTSNKRFEIIFDENLLNGTQGLSN